MCDHPGEPCRRGCDCPCMHCLMGDVDDDTSEAHHYDRLVDEADNQEP